MKKRNKIIILNLLGTYFLVLGIIAIVKSLYRGVPSQILYACYIGTILIGIGILTKTSFIVLSQVYILAIPLLIWDVDFIHWLIFNRPLWGITDYFFFDFSATIDKFVTLQHLYTVPLAIYAVKLIGVKRKDAWKWSFIQLILMFVAVTALSPPELNVNCVFASCIDINYWLPYNIIWFLVSFSMTSITALFLNYFLWPKKRKVGRIRKR